VPRSLPHRQALATDALDEVRREVWNAARRAGDDVAAASSRARAGRCGRPREAHRQGLRLCSVQAANGPLYKAYLLKEQLRQVFQLPAPAALSVLDQWITWAQRCRPPAFVKVAATVRAHRDGALLSFGGLCPPLPRRQLS
jgi:transposase